MYSIVHILIEFLSYYFIVAQVSIGGECWSSANGVAAGGCASGTQCGPWLPDGGSWDGTSPWYCLALPKLASGATCDYATKVTVLVHINVQIFNQPFINDHIVKV